MMDHNGAPARHRGSLLHGVDDLLYVVLLDCEDGGSERLSTPANQDWHGQLDTGHLAMLEMSL